MVTTSARIYESMLMILINTWVNAITINSSYQKPIAANDSASLLWATAISGAEGRSRRNPVRGGY
jgi:hypothetical protein